MQQFKRPNLFRKVLKADPTATNSAHVFKKQGHFYDVLHIAVTHLQRKFSLCPYHKETHVDDENIDNLFFELKYHNLN